MNRDLELLLAFLRPIHALLVDDSVTEIMDNPDGSWWYERGGRVERADYIHFDAKSLHTGLEVIANRLGRKLDRSHPILNVQLPDGSRLAAVLPPVVRPAPSVTIRKFATVSYTMIDLIQRGALTGELAAYLRLQIEAGRTMLISGGTGSGKTTLLNALADFIPEHERLVIIEDTAELRIAKPNITYVAFTATPKHKTLELFCRRTDPEQPAGSTNLPQAFHVYSMRQVIEEGLILDVLKNYTTYKLAFKLAHDGKEYDETEVERSAAMKGIMRWVRLHSYNISQKVQVVVEHS